MAVEVLRLTRHPPVSLPALARVLESDPALVAGVLRTINSGCFGLAHPCVKIDRAIAMLGLGAVQAVVLGLCLLESTGAVRGEALDLTAHWRRSIYGAVAARLLAQSTGDVNPDEAFTAAMFQDIGVLAAFVADPTRYTPALRRAQRHDELAVYERTLLGCDHAAIGRALAEKWNLPPTLAAAIGGHHDPTTVPLVHRKMAEVVHLGTLAAEGLASLASKSHLGQCWMGVRQVFGNTTLELKPFIQTVVSSAGEMARLFDRDVGRPPEIKALLAEADQLAQPMFLGAHRAP